MAKVRMGEYGPILGSWFRRCVYNDIRIRVANDWNYETHEINEVMIHVTIAGCESWIGLTAEESAWLRKSLAEAEKVYEKYEALRIKNDGYRCRHDGERRKAPKAPTPTE